MKKFFCGLLVFLAFSVGVGIAQETIDSEEKEKMSYSFGMIIASDLVEMELEFDYDAFMRGFRDSMENAETLYTLEEAFESVNTAFLAVEERFNEQRRLEGEINLASGEAFLAENAQRPGIEITESGLQFEMISEGNGEIPGPADTVLVHYTGTTINGFVFDSSYEREEPLEVPLFMVIPGWSEGLRMMKEGGRAKLYIPPDLAYGEGGAGGFIGPNEVIIFEVELLSILGSSEEDFLNY